MDPIPNISVPIDSINSVIAEQRKLRQDIQENNKQRCELKNYVGNLIAAAVISNGENDSLVSKSTNSSSSATLKTIKSVESMQDILDDSFNHDPKNPCTTEDFVAMSTEGNINFTDELIKELYAANSRIDAINELGSKLQKRWSELDSTINDIKNEVNNIKNDVNNIKQYFKIDNLLLHKFRLPYKKLSSLEFCSYVAEQLNILLPYLPIPVSIHHISTAHPLPTKSRKSNVVVVRFCNRYVKEMIYECRHHVCYGVSITEHLTDHTIAVVKKAEALFGRHNVHTESCKVFVNCDGKFNLIKSIEEAHKLYANYCERIGANKHTFNKPSTYHHSSYDYHFPSYSNCVQNSSSYAPSTSNYNVFDNVNSAQRNNVQRHQSNRGRSNYYRGKPSTGYSVRNRVY